jgi:dihydroflavonol-4-reductase
MEANNVFLITGGAGYLGSEIIRQLLRAGEHKVRALVLPGDPLAKYLPDAVDIVEGDILNTEDLARFFDVDANQPLTVIHCASVISMRMKMVDRVWQINVQGTQNMIDACLRANVRQYIHVGSVHAIPELPRLEVMAEPAEMNLDMVVGAYGKTKAEAIDRVMKARREQGLPANVLYPAGLSGPGDYAKGNLTQMFLDYMSGAITMGVKGGYNFTDVRDVASAIVTLALRGKPGEDYVLAGEFISIMDLIGHFQRITGGKKITAYCPIWLGKAAMPIINLMYKIRRVKPVFSDYSLYTIGANSEFDSNKAARDLDYHPRSLKETIEDTASWLMAQQNGKKG